MTTHDSRVDLIEALKHHRPSTSKETSDLEAILDFLNARQKPFDRNNLDAHLTASAIIVNRAGTHVLMGHHFKLGRWLQLGGHGEPHDVDAQAVALRESREESGLHAFQPHPKAPCPLHIDIHDIPARGQVPAHKHLDIRFLFLCSDPGIPRPVPGEHHEVRWFSWEETKSLHLDDSLLVALEKAYGILHRS